MEILQHIYSTEDSSLYTPALHSHTCNRHHAFKRQYKLYFFFTVAPCILILSKFYYQLMHKRNALKRVLKFTLKQLQHISVSSLSSGSVLYELAEVTMLKQSIKIHRCG